jgi:hypothetical protein
MKTTNKIKSLVLILVVAGSMALNAQNGRANGSGQFCSTLPDLTEKQKTELTALAKMHQSQMDALRTEMRGTTYRDKKSEVWTKMQEMRNSHRSEVLNLLTDKQKETFNSNGPAKGGMTGKGPMSGICCGMGPCGGNGFGFMNGRK